MALRNLLQLLDKTGSSGWMALPKPWAGGRLWGLLASINSTVLKDPPAQTRTAVLSWMLCRCETHLNMPSNPSWLVQPPVLMWLCCLGTQVNVCWAKGTTPYQCAQSCLKDLLLPRADVAFMGHHRREQTKKKPKNHIAKFCRKTREKWTLPWLPISPSNPKAIVVPKFCSASCLLKPLMPK